MVINNLSDYEEKHQRCQEYVNALEEEKRKIQVFQRELPLCLELVTQAIESCKQQLTSGASEYHFNGTSECSEQTSSEGPVLEEFIPIKRSSTSSDDEDQLSKRIKNNSTEIDSNINECVKDTKNIDNKASKKSDWLRSVQLWNQSPDPTPKEDTPKKVQVVEVRRDGSGGAFHPFKRENNVGTSSTCAKEKSGGGGSGGCKATAATSSVETGGSSGGGEYKKEEKEGERKQRRCWSPELHRRFLQALQQLGGSHVATPKQIRELMKVDGLTNDEVKSHLQKYRLHTRRPNPSMHNNNTQQAPQFVVVGGIWVPPPEYAAMAATPSEAPRPTTPNGIYAPIASLPSNASTSSKERQQQKNSSSEDHGSHSENGSASHSPATSSSDTTTGPSAY
ncbi:DNA-binding transcription factor [Lithospermum erythrorhizon]|uniref:DNA-binding transcription factor n=1 Tax=Lithospermum erythrorhizon TaxID=34254 RepID=A0AAV3R7S6_LITER